MGGILLMSIPSEMNGRIAAVGRLIAIVLLCVMRERQCPSKARFEGVVRCVKQ